MRKWLVGLIVVAMTAAPAMAHPGGTDSSGGHYNRSTGEYHYHHGYSAHDHVDGVCPYDYDDKTGERPGSSGGSSYGYASYAAYAIGNAQDTQVESEQYPGRIAYKKKQTLQRVVVALTGLVATGWIWWGIIGIVIDEFSLEARNIRRAIKPYKQVIKHYPNYEVDCSERVFHVSDDCEHFVNAPDSSKGSVKLRDCVQWKMCPCLKCTTPTKLRCKIIGVSPFKELD